MSFPILAQTVGLLVLSTIFMTIAWYGMLNSLASKPWWFAVLSNRDVALFKYLLQLPANRIGHMHFSLAQLKIMQEAITLTIFVPFSLIFMKQPFKLDTILAALCLVGAVFFIFRS